MKIPSKLVFFTIIALSSYLLRPAILNAAENWQELAIFYPDQTLKADVDFDDVDESIDLLTADVDGDTGNQAYIIKVDDDGYITTKAELIDGWNLVYLFAVEIYPTLPPYIAVGYTFQGEIPYSIDLFRYKYSAGSYDPIKRIAHFESDIGSILLKDVDGDDIKEIVVRKGVDDVIYKYIDDDNWEIVSGNKTTTKENIVNKDPILVADQLYYQDGENIGVSISGKFNSQKQLEETLTLSKEIGTFESRIWKLTDILVSADFNANGDVASWKVSGPKMLLMNYVKELESQHKDGSVFYSFYYELVNFKPSTHWENYED